MTRCKFKTTDKTWTCYLEALPGDEYCYWHKIENQKNPSKEQIKELRTGRIFEVYLKFANLREADLKNAKLWLAHLENANLENADLKSANLEGANLKSTNLWDANLKNANLYFVSVNSQTNLTGAKLQYANLYRSYIDQTPTLRDAEIFNKDTWVEINEIVAELAKKEKQLISKSFEKYTRD